MIIQGSKTFAACRTCHRNPVEFEGAECHPCRPVEQRPRTSWWREVGLGVAFLFIAWFLGGCVAVLATDYR